MVEDTIVHLVQDGAVYPLRTLHRLLILQRGHFYSSFAESALLNLHAFHHLRSTSPTNDAPLRHAERPIRSARTTCKDVQLEGVHDFQHYRGTALEQSYGRHHLLHVVLPDRILQERWRRCQ